MEKRVFKKTDIYHDNLGERALGHKTEMVVDCAWCAVGVDLVDNPGLDPDQWLYWHHFYEHPRFT